MTWHAGDFVKRPARRGWWSALAAFVAVLAVGAPALGWWVWSRAPVGAAHAAPPPSASPSSSAPSVAAAERGQCDYVTADELSAAVTRGAGRALATVGATETQYDCVYRFVGPGQQVRADWSSSTDFRPGTATELLTVDGFRAMYTPGEGDRVLSVYTEAGNFSVVVWLDGVNDTLAKKIATEVFRVALPRLPTR